MTLPLRKKLLTTVLSTRSQVKAPSARQVHARTRLKQSLGLGLLVASTQTSLQAQTSGWQPNRLPNSAAMQPLNNSAAASNQASPPGSSASNNSGVVLRWRTSARVQSEPQNAGSSQSNQANSTSFATPNSANAPSLAARALEANATPSGSTFPANTRMASHSVATGSTSSPTAVVNPLRTTVSSAARPASPSSATFVPRGTHAAQRSAVQPANYQAPAGNLPQPTRGNGLQDNSIAPPNLPEAGFQPRMPEPPANFPPITPQQPDALSVPEDAPAPPSLENLPPSSAPGAPPAQDSNPASPMPEPDNALRLDSQPQENTNPLKGDEPNDPFGNRKEEVPSPSDLESKRRSLDIEKKKDDPNASANCESFREKLRSATIQKINLNAAPRYGQGLRDDPEDSEKQRLDFAASSEVRDWCDRRGRTIIQGRMIDLVNEQVVLDINGVRREIPLRDLCDIDLAYIGKVWHLPVTCGSGYEQVAGRNFVPSAIQWKASGLCHKPLYFEEVQLERYGHEIGPILQPLVSTAHFFGNVAILPYKMGIHPPHECQYSLGYYRPGDCAPYMVPPVPISLRGAAVQAGAIVGGAALVP